MFAATVGEYVWRMKIAESQFNKAANYQILICVPKPFYLKLSKLFSILKANNRINFLWNYVNSRNDNWEYLNVIDMIA